MSTKVETIKSLTQTIQHLAAELAKEQAAHAETKQRADKNEAQVEATNRRIAFLEERIEELKTDWYRTENTLNNLLGY
jgi:chromosome segregation ATPase